jgi:hypothetical protein
MSDKEKPRLVATSTEEELAHKRASEARTRAIEARTDATDRVSWALRNMTANLLRIVRGAGKSCEVGGQIEELVQALNGYHKVVGHGPPPEDLSQMLSIDRDEEWCGRASPVELLRTEARDHIVRGALQITASRLVRQLTHEHKGEDELRDGILQLEEARAEMRREQNLAANPARKSPRRRLKEP